MRVGANCVDFAVRNECLRTRRDVRGFTPFGIRNSSVD